MSQVKWKCCSVFQYLCGTSTASEKGGHM